MPHAHRETTMPALWPLIVIALVVAAILGGSLLGDLIAARRLQQDQQAQPPGSTSPQDLDALIDQHPTGAGPEAEQRPGYFKRPHP
jgi:hypothetical protein